MTAEVEEKEEVVVEEKKKERVQKVEYNDKKSKNIRKKS